MSAAEGSVLTCAASELERIPPRPPSFSLPAHLHIDSTMAKMVSGSPPPPLM
ncbi:hypothetical protein BDY19DRAFT_108195 [Irpex rosettiformis]|uniref:Uncharacterized protein n=1 Tax=Irpex rosettiformis TaxID=378272 RepID=A0ACB8U543_9APHY|nr:hypothetical protein BDY19DRAFT_108195 [Irpex rosettiformis]